MSRFESYFNLLTISITLSSLHSFDFRYNFFFTSLASRLPVEPSEDCEENDGVTTPIVSCFLNIKLRVSAIKSLMFTILSVYNSMNEDLKYFSKISSLR